MIQRWAFSRLFVAALMLFTSVTSQARLFYVKDFGFLSASKLSNAGIRAVQPIRNEAGELVYQFIGENNQVVRQLVLGRSSMTQLRQFAPSNIEKFMKYPATIVAHKMAEFPLEAFSFFIAIGAVTARDLAYNYNQNPMATEQFFESQKSPVGMLGFNAFMIANGLVAEPLMLMNQTSKARFFIPYLGMSVGLLASNIVHEALSVPGLGQCVAELAKSVVSKTPASCDEAYEAWLKMDFTEKAHEWAPGLFSMILSTVIPAMGEMGVKWTAGTIVRMLGIELAISVTPGGWVVRGGRWLYKIGQLAAFTYLQIIIEKPIAIAWRSAVQIGPALKDSDQRLGILLNMKRANNWKPETERGPYGKYFCVNGNTENCYPDLPQELALFHQQAKRWRESNLESVMTAHMAWLQYLGQLSSQYRVAKQFYFDFVGDVWRNVYQSSPGYISILDRSMPLYGVKPDGIRDDEQDLYLNQPEEIEKMQLATVQKVVQQIRAEQASRQPLVQTLDDQEAPAYRRIITGLFSNDPDKIGIAIQEMRRYLWEENILTPPRTSNEMNLLLRPIFEQLGRPKPLIAAGAGYLKLLTLDPNNVVYQTSPYPKTVGALSTPTAPEYLISQMIAGPDVEKNRASVIANTSGFAASFRPPTIRAAGRMDLSVRQLDEQVSEDVRRSLFSQSIRIDGEDKGTIFDFLRKGGIRSTVLGSEKGQNISNWWAQYPEQELLKAYISFEQKYEDIIVSLYNRLFQVNDGSWNSLLEFTNRGPFANGVLEALRQERNVYLLILNDLWAQQKQSGPVALVSDNSIVNRARTLETNPNLDPRIRNLLQKWQVVTDLFRQIEQKPVLTTTQEKKTFFVSRLKDADVDAAFAALGVEIARLETDAASSAFQKQVIKTISNNLQEMLAEFEDYTQTINNVSYVANWGTDEDRGPVKRRCLSENRKKFDSFGPLGRVLTAGCP